MAYEFNPFTGTLDKTGGGDGSTPPVTSADTEVIFNNAGTLDGSADLTWDDTGKTLTVGGDIDLDDGGTYATTLQVITPTANRTISYPDATGTLALVAGSSGQLIYNNAGANAGVPNSVIGATGDVTLGLAGAASTPPLKLTGTWFTGGTATTTKPQVLIEPSGTTSTAWSTSGTGLGVNAASGFAGNLLDLQVDGVSKFNARSNGVFGTSTAWLAPSSTGVFRVGSATADGRGIIGLRTIVGSSGFYGFSDSNSITDEGDYDLAFFRDAADTLAQRRSTNAQTYRLYNTYTDASNYQRTSITDDSTGLVIDQQYAGTGAVRTNLLDLKNNGTSKLKVSQFGDITGTVASIASLGTLADLNNGYRITHASGIIRVAGSTGQYSFSPGNDSRVAADTGLKRDQAGVVALTDGSTGVGYLKTTPVAVSALPAAATVGAGTRGFVSDSTVAASGNFGATVTGGGSNNVPVFSDGTNWLIG